MLVRAVSAERHIIGVTGKTFQRPVINSTVTEIKGDGKEFKHDIWTELWPQGTFLCGT